MAKEILLYYPIYSTTASDLIKDLDAAKEDDIEVRICSPGGEVYNAYGVAAKFQENSNSKKIKVDGIAASMAAFLCCYADEVECLDVSAFLFHRAAFWYEENPNYFTEEVRAALTKMNKDLRAAMESKMTSAEFEKETGVSYDALFSLESRIDVMLSAKQALKLGLVKRINKITPSKKKEVEALASQFAAKYNFSLPVAEEQTELIKAATTKNLTSNTMTIEKLMAEHPEVYAAAVKHGVTAERDRIGSFMAFNHIDPKAVKAGIDSGETMTETQRSEFSLKAVSALAKNQAAADNADDTDTPEPDNEGKEGKVSPDTAAALASTRKLLGLNAKA